MTENRPSRWHDFMSYAVRQTNDDCYDLFSPRARTLCNKIEDKRVFIDPASNTPLAQSIL